MEQKQKIERMKALIATLNAASQAYYQESRELMPNYAYDALYDELAALEAETGMTLSQSPTQRVGYEVLSQLPKEKHPQKMLSLDKTKDVDALGNWLGAQDGVLSWKLDGLTIVLTYEDGVLVKVACVDVFCPFYLAFIRHQFPCDNAHESRLAFSVRSNKSDMFSFKKSKRNI